MLAFLLYAVCIHAGYAMSYWNRPFFPEYCGDGLLDDHTVYDTMVRIAGSFYGISQAYKTIVDYYGWTHIVLVSDQDTGNICWYAAKPFDEVFANNENYTFTWFILGNRPTDEQLDNVLQQIRSRTRGFCYDLLHVPECYYHDNTKMTHSRLPLAEVLTADYNSIVHPFVCLVV